MTLGRSAPAHGPSSQTGGHAAIVISAGVAACRSGGLPAGALPTTAYPCARGLEYFPLMENIDVRSIVSHQDPVLKMPPCR